MASDRAAARAATAVATSFRAGLRMCGEILQRCSEAVVVLRRQEEVFNACRGLEANRNAAPHNTETKSN